MKPDEILDAMEHIDPELIEAANKVPKRNSLTGMIAALAAMLVLLIGISMVLWPNTPVQMGTYPTASTAHVHVSGNCPCGWSPFFPTSGTQTTAPSDKIEDYTILKHAEKSYIVFKEISIYENNTQQVPESIGFSSISEFVNSVTKGELKQWQKEIIATRFPRDENGVLICDFSHIYEPVTPSGSTIDGVDWNGEVYSFSLTIDKDVFGYIHYYTPNIYNDIFISDYQEFFERDTITVTSTETLDDGKVATYYYTKAGKLMQVRYSLSDGDKTFVVDKTYRLNMENSSANISASIPSNVTLYCIEGNTHYVVDLFGFTKDPTDSWLLSFGLRQYVEGEPIINDPYKIYLESNLLEDYSTERLGHDVIQENRIDASEDVPDKTVTLFGQTITLSYKETWQSNRPTRNRVFYEARDKQTGGLYWASFDSATGALRYYYNSQAGNDRSYKSEVNEHSSEAEFLVYAKKIVSQYASVEGCEVEIETKFYEYNEKYGHYSGTGVAVDGYVNNADNIPDFYAVYTFTFYKTIDGVRLWDINTIEINNTGEVHLAEFYLQDDVYEDFFDIDIDMEQAERLVHGAYAGEIVRMLLVATTDGALWLHIMLYWGIEGGGGSCNTYAIPIVGGI